MPHTIRIGNGQGFWGDSPDAAYERRWAEAVLAQALNRLHEDQIAQGNYGNAIEIDNQLTVTLSRALLHNNRSNNGGGVHMSAGATLVVQNGSLLYLNEALTGNGGGINCTGGSVTVSGDSYVGFWLFASLGNSAAGNGGGVAAQVVPRHRSNHS